jgi:alpha/beta superfamily hydrolase
MVVLKNRRTGTVRAVLVSVAVALVTVGVALGQGIGSGPLKGPIKNAAKGGRGNVKGRGAVKGATKKVPPNAADPLAVAPKEKDQAAAKDAPVGSFHYKLKIHSFDDTTLAASYYPGKIDTTTPVVLLVHEKDRSSKDFDDSITELKGLGLAENLQSAGYAVLTFDLRGYGANTRRPVSDRDWVDMIEDLQMVYQFLLDRHNRGELNLAKLGVVALGEGANLAAAWAYQPGGAVSSEGRVTDLAALVLVSPLPEAVGYKFSTLMSALAPRIPVLLMAGERDGPSHDAVKKVRANVEKTRLNKVELFPSSLHGYKLLRLEPKVTTVVAKFLEGTVKLKPNDWEPRYNLTPVAYTDIQVVKHVKPGDKDKAKEEAKEKDVPKEKEKAKEEAKEKDKDKDKEAHKAKADEPADRKGAAK